MDFAIKIRKASRVSISMEFDEILLGTSRFDEIWAKGSCLHLDDTSIYEKEFGVLNL
jgi:hypothetical protein